MLLDIQPSPSEPGKSIVWELLPAGKRQYTVPSRGSVLIGNHATGIPPQYAQQTMERINRDLGTSFSLAGPISQVRIATGGTWIEHGAIVLSTSSHEDLAAVSSARLVGVKGDHLRLLGWSGLSMREQMFLEHASWERDVPTGAKVLLIDPVFRTNGSVSLCCMMGSKKEVVVGGETEELLLLGIATWVHSYNPTFIICDDAVATLRRLTLRAQIHGIQLWRNGYTDHPVGTVVCPIDTAARRIYRPSPIAAAVDHDALAGRARALWALAVEQDVVGASLVRSEAWCVLPADTATRPSPTAVVMNNVLRATRGTPYVLNLERQAPAADDYPPPVHITPVPGLHRNVVEWDVKSMYPSIFLANPGLGPWGEGVLQQVLRRLVDLRAEVHPIHSDDVKLAGNVVYGVVGRDASGPLSFRNLSIRVVQIGSALMRRIIGACAREKARLVYANTDSVFVVTDDPARVNAAIGIAAGSDFRVTVRSQFNVALFVRKNAYVALGGEGVVVKGIAKRPATSPAVYEGIASVAEAVLSGGDPEVALGKAIAFIDGCSPADLVSTHGSGTKGESEYSRAREVEKRVCGYCPARFDVLPVQGEHTSARAHLLDPRFQVDRVLAVRELVRAAQLLGVESTKASAPPVLDAEEACPYAGSCANPTCSRSWRAPSP